MRPDGSDLTRLTHSKGRDLAPEWSPDGQWIVFQSFRDGDTDLYITDFDGQVVRRLTNQPGFDGMPEWSPDGQWIAFVSERDGNREIYRVRPDGTDIQRLTNNLVHDAAPAWSPPLVRVWTKTFLPFWTSAMGAILMGAGLFRRRSLWQSV